MKQVADISTTTQWEKELAENPETFEKKMKDFVRQAVSTEIRIDRPEITADEIKCPLCGKPVKESAKSWFCTGYKDGCKFKSLWKETRGAKFTKPDIKALCEGKKTSLKKCTKKDGGNYECRFILNRENSWELEPLFEKNKKKVNRHVSVAESGLWKTQRHFQMPPVPKHGEFSISPHFSS